MVVDMLIAKRENSIAIQRVVTIRSGPLMASSLSVLPSSGTEQTCSIQCCYAYKYAALERSWNLGLHSPQLSHPRPFTMKFLASIFALFSLSAAVMASTEEEKRDLDVSYMR